MLQVEGVSPELVESISPEIETFISSIKSGTIGGYKGTSLSTAAAQATVRLMGKIIERFQEFENEGGDAGSPTMHMRQKGLSEVEVVSNQVQRLLMLVARTSAALIRPQFGTLLLTNVTRRVLSIIRDTAAETRASAEEIEKMHNGSPQRFSVDESHSHLDEEDFESGTFSPHLLDPIHSTGSAAVGIVSPAAAEAQGEGWILSGNSALLSRTRSAYGYGSPMATVEIPGQHALRRAPQSWQDLTSLTERQMNSSITTTGGMLSSANALASSTKAWPSPSPLPHHEFPVRLQEFYDSCLRGLEEFEQEVEAMTSELCKRVDRQIHRGDVLITIGCTHTVRQYLLAASRLQTFRVLLLDGAPTSSSAMVDQLAAELAERHVDVQRLPDSSAFAVMNTCTKVVIGAESVLANGGMLGQIGTRMLCVAARHFAVPVLVATTTLKMSPYYPSDQLCSRLVRITKARAQELPWSIYGAPELVLPMPQGVWVKCDAAVSRPADSAPHRGIMGSRSPAAYSTSQSSSLVTTPTMAVGVPPMGPVNTSHSRYHTAPVESIELSEVSVHCASTEYVPPEYVTLYATNDSELAPSQCHRIIRANYNDAD